MRVKGNLLQRKGLSFNERQREKFIQQQASGIMDKPLFPLKLSISEYIDVPQHCFAISDLKPLATTNLQQCCAVVLHDPVTKQTALLHVDMQTTKESITAVCKKIYSGNTLEVHLVGGDARLKDLISTDNTLKVISALEDQNVNIITAAIRGVPHPTAIIFDPISGTLCRGNNDNKKRFSEQEKLTRSGAGEFAPKLSFDRSTLPFLPGSIFLELVNFAMLAPHITESSLGTDNGSILRREIVRNASYHALVSSVPKFPLCDVTTAPRNIIYRN